MRVTRLPRLPPGNMSIDHTGQEHTHPEIPAVDHQLGIGDRSAAWNPIRFTHLLPGVYRRFHIIIFPAIPCQSLEAIGCGGALRARLAQIRSATRTKKDGSFDSGPSDTFFSF